MRYKQVIAVVKDIKLTKGKMAVQVAHASLGAYEKSELQVRKAWMREGMKKVVVYVNTKQDLYNLKAEMPRKIPKFLVRDAGLTQLIPGTVTAMGIGPAESEELDRYTRDLKLV